MASSSLSDTRPRREVEQRPGHGGDRNAVDHRDVHAMQSFGLVHDKTVVARTHPAGTGDLGDSFRSRRQRPQRSPRTMRRDRSGPARPTRQRQGGLPGHWRPGEPIRLFVHANDLARRTSEVQLMSRDAKRPCFMQREDSVVRSGTCGDSFHSAMALRGCDSPAGALRRRTGRPTERW